MSLPVPVVTAPADLTDLPVGSTYQFDGTSSTPGVSYEWTLVEKPDGSAAALSNPTNAQPTLTNVDTRGTYIVFLKVTNSQGSSHAYPYPTQAATPPYAFTTPLATAFGVLRIAEEGNPTLFKPGRGEYGWFEKGLWPLFDKVAAGAEFEYYDEPTRTLTANAIVPDESTPEGTALNANSLRIVTAESGTFLSDADGIGLTILSDITVADADLTVQGGILRADEIRDASGGDIIIRPNARSVTYAAGGIVLQTGASISADAENVVIEASDAIDLSATTLLAMSAGGGDVSITAGDDITISATGANGDITISATGADGDILISAPGATGSIALQAQGVSGAFAATASTAAVTASTGNLTLAASGLTGTVVLAPALATTSTKPVFAPGFAYVDTAVASGFDKPQLVVGTFTRHILGSELVTDMLIRLELPKPESGAFVLKLFPTGVAGAPILEIPSGTSEGEHAIYLRSKCSARIVSDTRLIVHVEANISDELTGGLKLTLHKFATYEYPLGVLAQPISFEYEWAGAALTSYDYTATAKLINGHNEAVL